jgi:GGDEF domain-containing protein
MIPVSRGNARGGRTVSQPEKSRFSFNLNLNVYLFINLVVLCFLVLGLWRGRPVWDTPIQPSNLLVLLVVINTVLIFREGLLAHRRKRRARPASEFHGERRTRLSLSSIRADLAARPKADDALVSDALQDAMRGSGHAGGMVLLLEPTGHFSVLAEAGAMPPQVQTSRLVVTQGRLAVRHAGNLGEEPIASWEGLTSPVIFSSHVTHLALMIVPLTMVGKVRGLWVLVPARARPRWDFPVEALAIFLEGVLNVDRVRVQSGEGRFVDARTGLLRFEAFKEAFETEVERSERYHQNMTLMSVAVTPFETLPAGLQDAVQQVVALALRESLRRLDLMFCGGAPGRFAAILTETKADVARLVSDRVQSSFRKHAGARADLKDQPLRLTIGTATYPTDATHGEGLQEKTAEALQSALEQQKPVVAYDQLLGDQARTASLTD